MLNACVHIICRGILSPHHPPPACPYQVLPQTITLHNIFLAFRGIYNKQISSRPSSASDPPVSTKLCLLTIHLLYLHTAAAADVLTGVHVHTHVSSQAGCSLFLLLLQAGAIKSRHHHHVTLVASHDRTIAPDKTVSPRKLFPCLLYTSPSPRD